MKRLSLLCSLLALSGCRSDDDGEKFTAEEAMDPENCKDCHPQHYQEWLGSMHAYAAEDPVFLAMNELGQERTNGELGDFCVQCHAPVAVKLGKTEDGLNLDELPQYLKGVTCYACHNVDDVTGKHNNPLQLSMDNVMRGGIKQPESELAAHEAEWSRWLAGSERETRFTSSQMCGSCHDIVTPAGVHLERTYDEWENSLFSQLDEEGVLPAYHTQSCVDCHMGPPMQGPAADVDGVPGDRLVHPHDFPGVDVQITDFPNAELGPEIKNQALEAIENGMRRSSLCSAMCVKPADGGGFDVRVWLHNEAAGHAWPSGATQDRRAWIELVGYEEESPVYESGVIDDGDAIATLDDPNLWLIREQMFDDQGQEVHMFWEARDVDGNLLEVAAELTPQGDAATWQSRDYFVDVVTLDRVTSKVRIRAMGLEVIDELIAEGVLDSKHRAAFEIYDMPSTVLDWTPEASDTFCNSSKTDCGDFGACIAPRVGDQIALTCTPLELQKQCAADGDPCTDGITGGCCVGLVCNDQTQLCEPE
jgi:hypothetical protein